MSRVLAELLGSTEPAFRQQIQRLEQAAGRPAADIRLATQVVNETRAKIRELGLDPQDTTGKELFQALQVRLREDEARIRDRLGVLAAGSPTEVLEAVRHRLEKSDLHKQVFVVKRAALRQILKTLQPKATMKVLGYRSLDSMLKHEPVPQLLAASLLVESKEWHRKRIEAYKKLSPRDFESRAISVHVPTAKQWPRLAEKHISESYHNILSLPEVGAVVLLPMKQDLPGLAITTVLLSVDVLNDMRARSSFLKLQQVRPDFGDIVQKTMLNEPLTDLEMAGQQLPWKVVQWFYGHGHSEYHPEIFQPHIQPDDLQWHDAERVLTDLHPALEFWEGSQLLALLDGSSPVSLNVLDVSLTVCNGLEYSERVIHNMRASLGRELFARYLHQDNLQALLLGKLDRQLAPELAFD